MPALQLIDTQSALSRVATLAAFGVALTTLLLAVYWQRRDRRLDKVPGPKGNPITGIGLNLPPDAADKFREWANEYGEVYKIRVGWWTWVVLNSPDAVKEVFDKQSISTSSKIPAPMTDLVVGGRRMPTMSYGPKWRKYRVLCHQLLTPKMTEAFVPLQMHEIGHLLYDLGFNTPDETSFRDHIHRTLFSILMKAVYGRRIERNDDDDVRYTQESAKVLAKLSKGGAYIEDIFPLLAKLPTWLQPSRRQALHDAKWLLWVKMRMWNTLKEQLASEVAPSCYAAQMIKTTGKDQQSLEDEDLAWIAGGLVDAGSATSTSTTNNLMLYLAGCPEAQARASQEIKDVVGTSRLPTMSDIPKLPFVFACIKEILRLCPVPPWSITHFTDADVTLKDIVIPKGTAVVCNTMALNFDPVRYPDPFAFKPERYINFQKSALEYAGIADPNQRDHFTFGSGRRICPGARLAENNVALILANILWAFEIKPPLIMVNGNMREAPVDLSDNAFGPYPVRSAKPFKARFLPRSNEHLDIIRQNWEASQKR